MMPGAVNQGSVERGTFVALLIIVCGTAFFIWLLWQEQNALVSQVAMRIFYEEIRFIQLFSQRFDVAAKQLLTVNPERVRFDQLVRMAREIGQALLFTGIVIVLGSAAVCLRYAAPSRYRRNFDLDGLMREQAKTFRGAAAFSGRKLGLVEPREKSPRPADLALSCEEWLSYWARGEDGRFEEGRARAELIRQLGGRWVGVQDLAPASKVMLWAMALHLAGRRGDAISFLGDLSQSLSEVSKSEGREGPLDDLAFPERLIHWAATELRSTGEGRRVSEIMARHAYVVPGLMTVLATAREASGILPPSQFAFLKLADRRLWFALQSLGSPAAMLNPALHPNPCVEALAARDHWAAECLSGQPLYVPSIERAMGVLASAANGM